MRSRHHSTRDSRKGSMLVLVSISLVAVIAVSAFAANLSYVELCRSESRLASDASAKAAVAALGTTQSRDKAIAKAQRIAQLHSIAGKPVELKSSDIEFGNCARDAKGEFVFVRNLVPINSVRVTCATGNGIPDPLLSGQFNVSNSTIATRVDNDICLVIDRSASMAWDLSNAPFSYPGEQNGKSRLQNYFTKPSAIGSRWKAVQDAVVVFNSVIDKTDTLVGLATFSSDLTFGAFTSRRATIDLDLGRDSAAVVKSLQVTGQEPIIGNTNIAAGLGEGIRLLQQSSNARSTAYKTVVLLSDGKLTEGGDPVAVATSAKASNLTIHTIAFSAQADIALMKKIADAGGGSSHVAADAATLREAFRAIAESIPSIIAQ